MSVAIADNGVDAISKLTVEDVKNRIVTTVTIEDVESGSVFSYNI